MDLMVSLNLNGKPKSVEGAGFGFDKRALNSLEGAGFGFDKRHFPIYAHRKLEIPYLRMIDKRN